MTLPETDWPGGYPELGLAILDAIWSIGANYDRHVKPLIARYRDQHPEADRHTAHDLAEVVRESGGPGRFAECLENRQRTSTRNGILKAEAVFRAAEALSEIETAARFRAEIGSSAGEEVERAWKAIPGQRSGISFRYLCMLTGAQGVKADRMIIRFVENTLGRQVSSSEAAALVEAAAPKAEMSPTEADHRIWSWQREQ